MTRAKRTFSYEQALHTFPKIRSLTEIAVRQVEALVNQVQGRSDLERRRQELEQACQQIVDGWSDAVTALGCQAKEPWLVDWDCGSGYYSWRYPEVTIASIYAYEDSYQGRMPVN